MAVYVIGTASPGPGNLAIANTSLSLSGEWIRKADLTGEPVKLVIHS